MRTRFSVAAHLSAEELAARYRAANDPVLRSRFQMIRLLVSGRPLAEVAEVTGYSTRWVREVVRRYNEAGPEGLGDRRHANRGAEPLLDAAGRAALEAVLDEPPPEGGLWTGRKVGRDGSPGASAARPSGWRRSAAGTTSGASGTAAKCPGRGTRRRRRRTRRRKPPCKKPERGGRGGARPSPGPAGRGLGLRRAPRRPQAGAAPGLGEGGAAPHRHGPPALRVALPLRLRHLYGFVRPTSGAVERFLCNAVDTALFAAVLARFAAAVGAGADKTVILVLDNAGWHGGGQLEPPEGLRLVFLPPYTPELQPAERLWPLAREAIANRNFTSLAELDRALAARCLALGDRPDLVKARTHFHWWPAAA